MNEEFRAIGSQAWSITDNYLVVGSQNIAYSELEYIKLITTPTTPLTNGVVGAGYNGEILTLAFKHADKDRAHCAIDFAKRKIDEANGIIRNYKYHLLAHTGTVLEVYDDYVIITFMQTGSLLTNIARGGALGGKRIDFENLTAVQFREPSGLTVGFIQFAYPGSIESKGGITNAINDENSIPVQPKDVALAREIVAFIERRRKEIKQSNNCSVIQQSSAADELKKFKDLLDMGAITQEEFTAKKKQLLGLNTNENLSRHLSNEQNGWLNYYADLYNKGTITQAQFESKKRQLLG